MKRVPGKANISSDQSEDSISIAGKQPSLQGDSHMAHLEGSRKKDAKFKRSLHLPQRLTLYFVYNS